MGLEGEGGATGRKVGGRIRYDVGNPRHGGPTQHTLQHGDVVILRDDPVIKHTWTPPQVQMSAGTKQRYQQQGASAPWDPWAAAAAKLPSQAAPAGGPTIAMLDATIEQKIVSKLGDMKKENDVQMDPHEPRFVALEEQIQQLQAAQQSMSKQANTFETKLDYLNQVVEAQSSRLAQTMETKLTEQMDRIEALMSKRSRLD